MKNKKLLFSLGSISTLAAFPIAAVSCGRVVETPAKKIQDDFLKAGGRKEEIKNIWRQITIASLYKINVTNSYNTDNSEYIKTFNDTNSQLYKDSLEIFKVYAEDKVFKNGADGYYFYEKSLDWKKKNYFTKDQESKISNLLKVGEIPNEEIFRIFWNAEKTGIRAEIQKILLVLKYFEISNKEQLAKLDDKFKYNSSFLKYELENYNLTRYAVQKKPVQLWKKTAKTKITSEEDFFVTQLKTIKSIDTFNTFMKGSEDESKKISDIEKITDNAYESQLLGYQGINLNFSNYNLKWDEKNLQNAEANKLYGFYTPIEDRLILQDDELFKKGYSPYKGSKSDKEIVAAYLNQIAPIGQPEVELPKESNEKETEKVKLLSFKGTIFQNHLKKLAILFALKDSSLVDTAETAFTKLGYKLKVENDALKEVLKGEKFVEGEKDKDSNKK
ncbi:Uncharacterised protein (plasmid) [Mesomycoplasma conjunctivae]|nr:variable surface lipoprotein [Mycoplasmopsis fermentans]ADV34875.1 Putative P60-like lipoprotein [Mycoplasmopsis fermentans M64]VEU63981.1 Uncharacterised protein [Mycoplasmopsis fermentans]VEU67347.1 Uncharacterised protein [Mesomycoplasma conjunctivae]